MKYLSLIVLALGLAACTEDFAPGSLLVGPRLLAVEVSPLEVGPGERVSLSPRYFLPSGAKAPAATWRFCPFTAGPAAGYVCAIPACETTLVAEADGHLEADPTALALSCLATLGASLGGAGTSSSAAELPKVVELAFKLQLSTADDQREVIVRVPYYPKGVPEPRNRPPVIEAVLIGGVLSSTTTAAAPLARDAKLEIVVRTAATSLDTYVDTSGKSRIEEPLVSYYSTAGRFNSDRASGVEASNSLEAIELKDGDDRALTFVVVRDGRGGQTWRGPFEIPIR